MLSVSIQASITIIQYPKSELGLVLWGKWIYGDTWDDAGDSAVHVSHCHGRSSSVPALQLRQEVIIVKRVAVSAVLSVNIH